MTSKVKHIFSEAHFDMISCFLTTWSMPYGKAIWHGHMAWPYGMAIWHGHMAEPYGSRGRGRRRGRGHFLRLSRKKLLSRFLPWKMTC